MKGNFKETFKNLKKETKGVAIGAAAVVLAVGGFSVYAATTGDETSTDATTESTTIEETTTEEITTVEETTSVVEETTQAAVQEVTQVVTEAPTVAEAPNAQYFTYQMVGDGQSVYITGYSGTESDLTIPSYLNGLKVVGIADDFSGAFSGNSAIQNVTIPNGVNYIGQCAFRGCKGLVSVSLPSTVTTIKGGAFLGCDNLHSLYIPASVTFLDPSSFSTNTTFNGDGARITSYSINLSVSNSSYAMQFCIDNGIPYTAY